MSIGDGFFAYLYFGFFGAGAVIGCVVALLVRGDGTAGPEEIGRATLLHEIERSRRYDRPMSLMHIPRAAVDATAPPDRDDDPFDEAAFEAVVGSLREIDFVWLGDDGAHVLLPECGRAEAGACLDRLAQVAATLDPSRVRLATFPDDGLTTGGLFAALSGEIERLPVNEVPAVLRGGTQAGVASA